ncbi:MAG: hypothetical protein IIA87_04590 [Nanoarchaeota archaeon]|nr:hypothetical protein [Nanoarchaeota archaeon]
MDIEQRVMEITAEITTKLDMLDQRLEDGVDEPLPPQDSLDLYKNMDPESSSARNLLLTHLKYEIDKKLPELKTIFGIRLSHPFHSTIKIGTPGKIRRLRFVQAIVLSELSENTIYVTDRRLTRIIEPIVEDLNKRAGSNYQIRYYLD